jgi:hypothetical protein
MVPGRSPGSLARLRDCCTAHAPAGCAVTPARCGLRVRCSVDTSTCGRLGTAASPARRGAGSMLAACRISHAVDAAVTYPGRAGSRWIVRWPPGRVVSRHRDDQRLDCPAGAGSSGPAPAGVVPLAGNEASVPAHDGARGDREDLRPLAAVDERQQHPETAPATAGRAANPAHTAKPSFRAGHGAGKYAGGARD